MDKNLAKLVLKKKREKPLLQKHPWVFSGAIHHLEGEIAPGDLLQIVDSNGRFLATAYYNRQSQIQARVLSWDADEKINAGFWDRRIKRAINGRSQLQLEPQTNAYRVINAEADGLPGLIVDKYGDYLVMQCLTLGIDQRKEQIINSLAKQLKPKGIVERSDANVRKKEGLPKVSRHCWGEEAPEELIIQENGNKFGVRLLVGHKTGFYLDQRDNRQLVCQPEHIANKDVLNLFSYTGGFGIYAAANNAKSVINVDTSAPALGQAERNVELNGWERPSDEYITGDAFELLREYRDANKQFDVIILDPPKFAHSQRDVARACRGYKDLNWLSMRLLKPGGLLATFSCSGLVSADLFQKVVFGASVDAKRDVQILHHLGQAPDHPVALNFPESAYLKGLLLRVW